MLLSSSSTQMSTTHCSPSSLPSGIWRSSNQCPQQRPQIGGNSVDLRSYALADQSTTDVKGYLQEKDIVMIPIASLEQHGPHLPLSTDKLQAEEIARRAGEKAKVFYTPC